MGVLIHNKSSPVPPMSGGLSTYLFFVICQGHSESYSLYVWCIQFFFVQWSADSPYQVHPPGDKYLVRLSYYMVPSHLLGGGLRSMGHDWDVWGQNYTLSKNFMLKSHSSLNQVIIDTRVVALYGLASRFPIVKLPSDTIATYHTSCCWYYAW